MELTPYYPSFVLRLVLCAVQTLLSSTTAARGPHLLANSPPLGKGKMVDASSIAFRPLRSKLLNKIMKWHNRGLLPPTCVGPPPSRREVKGLYYNYA